MKKLTKAQEKRFDEKFINHGEFVYNKGGYPVVCSELKQHLANELARERERVLKMKHHDSRIDLLAKKMNEIIDHLND